MRGDVEEWKRRTSVMLGMEHMDPRARQIPTFLTSLATHLDQEKGNVLKELDSLRKNIEHIKDIVAMQQSYAKVSGVCETVPVADLIEDALRKNSGAFVRHEVALVRDFQAQPVVTVEKHKVLQILVNLMRNAKYACEESGHNQKQMIVRVTSEDGRVRIAATVKTTGKTGVEMEALTGVSIAALTIYDMCKAVDRGMRIEGIRLLQKRGGKSGEWLAGGVR